MRRLPTDAHVERGWRASFAEMERAALEVAAMTAAAAKMAATVVVMVAAGVQPAAMATTLQRA